MHILHPLHHCNCKRIGADIRPDERAFLQHLALGMDMEESRVFVYPRMFSIHDMPSDAGLPMANTEGDEAEAPAAGELRVKLPAILNLSHERLTSDGVFLLENGVDLLMWVGRQVSAAVLSTLFGLQSLDGIDPGTLRLQTDNSDFSRYNTHTHMHTPTFINSCVYSPVSYVTPRPLIHSFTDSFLLYSRVGAVVEALREDRPARYMHLHFIRESDGPAEAYFARYLVEDR
jgi:hypothetical protein